MRQSNGADGARPENGMHPRRKYSLLAPEEPEGGRANAEPWESGDDHRDTRETSEEGRMETPTEDETGQCMLLARGMQ